MFALLGALFLAGCATTQVQDTPENIVRQRAKARWDALVAGEKEKAYQFLSPSYRALRDFNYYQRTISGGLAQWKSADVIGVQCKPDACTARIRIEFQILMKGYGNALNTHYDESWILEKGDWWFYERP